MTLPLPDSELASLPASTRGYLLGAALVARFRPERLTAVDPSTLATTGASGADRSQALAFVLANAHPVDVGDPGAFAWSLDDDLRRRTLQGVGGLDRLRRAVDGLGLDADREPLRTFFDFQASHGPPTPPASLDKLSTLRQAFIWLQPYDLEGDAKLHLLDREIERVGLVAPLRRLANDAFVGRDDELTFLRRFVGVLPEPEAAAKTILMRVSAAVGNAIGGLTDWVTTITNARDVVLVTAPGGMGKSTLLAKFLLEHIEADAPLRTAFALVDFDRPSLISRDPRVLLDEIGRQISIQTGTPVPRPWAPDADGVAASASIGRGAEAVEASDVDRAYFIKQQALEYAHGLGSVLARSAFAGRPMLLVLDTLERVFRRGRHWVAALDDLIGILRQASVDVRVVAAGRAFLSEQRANQSLASRALDWRERSLRELPPTAAEALLVRRGLAATQSRAIARDIGGVPLSLHLAADYVLRPGADANALGSATRGWMFRRRLSDAVVQGNLYQRILTHIEDPLVRELAYPGLILREVTPALIADVLAGPCGLGEVSPQRARALFAALAQEFTLVDAVGQERLRHRSDVRQVMLQQMLEKEADKARAISEGAVRYYDRFDDARNVAEGLYHRMLLGADRQEIERRWVTGVEDYLGEEIVDEIPSIPMRVYAAGKLGLEIRDADWQREADRESFERKVTQDVDERLKLGQVREALALVAGHAEFSAGSPLYPQIAQAHADLRDPANALMWLDAGLQRIDDATVPAARQSLLPLYLVRARIFDHIIGTEGAAEGRVAEEIEQLDSLWREYPGDMRVLLVGLLEFEVLRQRAAPNVGALRRWLERRVSSARSDGAAIDASLALRMLPALLLDEEGRSVDLARWLLDMPGVAASLARILQRFETRSLDFNGVKAARLLSMVALRIGSKPPLNDAPLAVVTPELPVDALVGFAHAVRLSAQETRVELGSAKR